MLNYPGTFLHEHFQRRSTISKRKKLKSATETISTTATLAKKTPQSTSPMHLKENILKHLITYNPHHLHQALRKARSNGVSSRNMVDRTGVPLICIATNHCNGQEGTIKLLITFGASANAMDRYDGLTPLHIATANRYTKVVEYLLSCGADPNAADARGRTPLMIASFKKFDHLQYVLQGFGKAAADLEDHNGSSALSWSSHGVHPGTMIDPFLDYDGKQEKKLGLRMHMRY
jgi:hypothetical protein